MDALRGATVLPTLQVAKDAAGVAELAARFLVSEATRAIGERGRFRLALAGGNTPRATYEQLSAPEVSGSLDFDRVDVFFGDERLVAPDDPASNYRMAREAFLSRVPIPERNVHRIHGELDAETAAARYVRELGDVALDVALLGMGGDGHVASLFPGTPSLDDSRAVLPSTAPVVPHARVTVGFSVLDAARAVVLLVTGGEKALRLAEAYGELRRGAPRLPVSLVRPASGRYHWFLDAAAGANLPPDAATSPR